MIVFTKRILWAVGGIVILAGWGVAGAHNTNTVHTRMTDTGQ